METELLSEILETIKIQNKTIAEMQSQLNNFIAKPDAHAAMFAELADLRLGLNKLSEVFFKTLPDNIAREVAHGHR